MAEQIPYGVATSLVNRLASAAFREFGRIYGVMDELERLKNTIEVIRAVLLDAEEKQEKSPAVQVWVRRLKDVLLPADDLIDEFLIEDMIHKRDKAHKNKVTQVIHSFLPSRTAFRRKMAHEIEKIQRSFKDVEEDMSYLKLNNVVVVAKTNNVRRETCSYVLESEIIGREEDQNTIISLLRQSHEHQNVSLVAIVGIGGLGKTALAQLVYKDGEVKNLFEKHMWVCVSDNFDFKTILKNMVASLTKDDVVNKTLQELQSMLQVNLTGQRYLLVLDDVWNECFEKWDQLRPYLMCGAQGSKVVMTTCSKIVADRMGVSDQHVLRGLTPEKSWVLFKNIVFGDVTVGVNQPLESIGKKIAEKCKGVPLAIRSLGGILRSESKESEWINVLQGECWKLCDGENSIMPVLKLSYQNLSPQQRQCFAYCSLFPQDWEFEKDELIQMWMAQGYLGCSVENQCMEDVGNQFVNIFLKNSFFQDANFNDDGDVTGFKMHDLMHDLATQVAGNDCCYLDSSKANKCLGRPVHVLVKHDALCLLESLDSSRLRTLIVMNYNHYMLPRPKLSVIRNFKYLRFLKMQISSSQRAGFIEKLKHLRHLDLRNYESGESLSKSICNFVCLQTIKLKDFVVDSPEVVSKLINLRHLKIYNGTFKDKTPSGFRKLSIQQPKGLSLSNWLSPLTNIIEISLSYCRGFQHLPPLERLPFLKSLELRFPYELEYIYYEEPILHESFFPSLEILAFYGCDKLKGWRRMGDDLNDINSSHHLLLRHFPYLSQLVIYRSKMLTLMPTFPNIKRLSMESCSTKILEATLNVEESQYSNGFPPLSMLKSLKIDGTSMENVPKDWLKNLTSLENICFSLSSQQFEVIEMWFKDDLIYLPSLQTINFTYCGFKALPDWICKISSLQHLKMFRCKLVDLPEGMSRLTNLHTLEIIGCSILDTNEFLTETGALWSKIAHIPKIIKRNYFVAGEYECTSNTYPDGILYF
ncbi:putative P-loop containing nucleoside triphosphate hydrolase, leucine-rich repeat domain, L [Medicago truncatula]|uniref:NBS-LRR type disease resistance protein n=1 Tax=Medicago truncatula TaxID=3880 RepID=G7LEA9_MEDTR|nr:putative disease resistance protein RGA3 [Medicago truncatula]XP_024628097.1 putative disease resistance protein RGA3 [Medicago truncatula]XP_039684387.1 putative disease resistance protein RGA3 [Medicago truncatula]XP_039684388.1 putative disease resistance protein RGA3 [Medicago truncatula]AET01333.2 NBS-LRR type disease resistance protein [Medicago truncatula]RHN38929.1 putative P-loop containing nucleoside triphosphate hydrolase, leucine-rich repeat domain, L [Medicago truncatula]